MEIIQTHDKSLSKPPGGVLVWFIITLELLTFIAGIFFYFQYRSTHLSLFKEMQSKLNLDFAIWNTFFLITSGYFVALALNHLKNSKREDSRKKLMIGIFFGLGFIFLKSFEYYEKLSQGFDVRYNEFFTFYWFLTFFHYMHVVFATLILTFMYFKLKENSENEINALEIGGALWHMCDLIWILLFPTLFFIR